MIEHPDARPSGSHAWRRAAIALALGVALVLAQPARGGVYRVAQCHPSYGVAHPDARFARTSDHYRADTACGGDGDGLTVRHRGKATNDGRYGRWSIAAPRGARVVSFSANLAGRAQSGHRPELIVGLGSSVREAGRAGGDRHWVNWSGSPASYMAARLRCARGGGCGAGEDAFVAMRRVTLGLNDLSSPRVGATGTLIGGGSRRGVHTLGAVASDAGSGVQRLDLYVNGTRVGYRTLGCALSGSVAVRVSPCPSGGSTAMSLDTAEPPFRHGENSILVCARDHASSASAARRDCERRVMRVDRLCPLAGAQGGRSLDIRVRRRGDRGAVRGTLRDAAGEPVAGARLCVATRVARRGEGERVEATPITDADGRFRARFAAGPSRFIRVAYWPSDDRALERFGRLPVPARPRLTLRPRNTLRNGERLRFKVELPGPAAGRREVTLQAAAGGRWLDLRRGRTNARGVYRTRYRFRATTGRRTYRFRAVVGRQKGYPYDRGRSRVRRATVTG